MTPWRLIAVKALPGHRLELAFADGLSGILDLSDERFTGVLADLADDAFFATVRLEDGAATWPGGLDLAPDAMYQDLKRTLRAA